MYEAVETGLFYKDKAREFKKWFDEEIGTEIETTEYDEYRVSFTLFDITHSEFERIKKKAKELGEDWEELEKSNQKRSLKWHYLTIQI